MRIKVPYAGGYGVKDITLPGPFESLASIKAANRKRREMGLQGGEYWGRAEIRFFDSKPNRSVLHGRFVVDSIQFHGPDGFTKPREYSIVMASDDGEVDKVAFPPQGWDGSVKGNESGDSEWTSHFLSPALAKNALKALLAAKQL